MKKVKSILLVDDDHVTQFINRALIKKLKLCQDVKLAMNGEEAIHYLKLNCQQDHNCPDLILLDLNMPVMDGFEFLHEYENFFSEDKRKPKIVVLTTSSSPNDIKRIFKFSSVSDYLTKPLTEEKLGSIIAQ